MTPWFAAAHPLLRWLGHVAYQPTWQAMQLHNKDRNAQTPDEIWFLEHPPIYTLGMNGKLEHVLAPQGIEVLRIDRGGQVTYHGPGQLMVYPLVDLRRAQLNVHTLVHGLEQAVIAMLAQWSIEAHARRDAPGVYVGECKLASIGIRVRHGCSYHGMALNVAMDLEPFKRINPCGYQGLEVIDLQALGVSVTLPQVGKALAPHLLSALGLSDNAQWLEGSAD